MKYIAFLYEKLFSECKEDHYEHGLHNDSSEVDIEKRTQHKTRASAKPSANSFYWRLLLLLVCIIISTVFPTVKIIQLQHIHALTPSLYAAIRFPLASLVLLPLTFRHWHDFRTIRWSVLIGIFRCLGYFSQVIGLITATANKGAFTASMTVVWVAFLSALINSSCRLQVWLSIAVAIAGISCLELEGDSKPVVGDLWLLLQPVGFGSAAVLLEKLLYRDHSSRQGEQIDYPESTVVTAFSESTVAIISVIWAIADGHKIDDIQLVLSSRLATISMLYAAIVCTALAQVMKNIVCKHVSASDVMLLLSAEPIFAALLDSGSSISSFIFVT
jgi:drug/metabolite transporter (DMT)-like permease